MRWTLVLALTVVSATGAGAEPRPMRRPAIEAVSPPGPAAALRPVARPDGGAKAPPVVETLAALQRSDRPTARDGATVQAFRATPQPAPAAPAFPRISDSGGLCGRPGLRGEPVAPVTGPGGCGIAQPVRITAVSGLMLSRPSRVDCDTARALDDWARAAVLPVVGTRGGGPVALRVAGTYACRTRNGQAGARISEHARGRAVDVAAIVLADGSEIGVERDWGRGADGRVLRELHRRACGIFGTVLGPDGDRFHQDHLHLDTAHHRNGSYCR